MVADAYVGCSVASASVRLSVRVCVRVCVCVRAVKEKQLELSTPNLIHIYALAGTRHELTLRSKGQRSMSQSYEVCCRRGYVCRYDNLDF